MSISIDKIRNFAIIAHIDAGKSTLSDRFLELTGAVKKEKLRAQFLDQMDLERERGITIKLQPVRLDYQGKILNLVDTPGHVDFTYEVSRSLAVVEGAILLVDATRGMQAQTFSTLEMALKEGLTIIPAVNKIDLPNIQLALCRQQIQDFLGNRIKRIYEISAKTGAGVPALLQAVIRDIPAPKNYFSKHQSLLSVKVKQSEESEKESQESEKFFISKPFVSQGKNLKERREEKGFRGLVFDSYYDQHRGVVIYVRIFDDGGQTGARAGQEIKFLASHKQAKILEVGIFNPRRQKVDSLSSGEIGYLVTNLKNAREARVGDTITNLTEEKISPLPGYQPPQSMVFAAVFPVSPQDYPLLADSLSKLSLNDASFHYQKDYSPILGSGFEIGFLGLLHLDILLERLRREFGLDLIVTPPAPQLKIIQKNGQIKFARGAWQLPDEAKIREIQEPFLRVEIFIERDYLGALFKLAHNFRAQIIDTNYLNERQVKLTLEMPVMEILAGFYDRLKSISAGFASLHYTPIGFRASSLVRLNVKIADELIEPLSFLVVQDKIYSKARQLASKLKKIIPRANFEIKIQILHGGRVIAAERISPLRKDVTAGLYGGDITRKRKLLEKQKQGKKRLKQFGRVSLPTNLFIKILSEEG